jgi:hypothetical protein
MSSTEEFPQEKTEIEAAFPDLDEMLDGLHEIAGAEESTPSETPDGGGQEETGNAPPAAAEEGGGAVSDTPSPVPPGYIDFEGQQLPVDQVRALLELDRRMREEPEVAQRVGQALKAPEEPAKLPDWIDPEDTQAVRLYEHSESIRAENDRQRAQLAQVNERDARARVVDAFRGAVGSFKAAHPNLNDEQIAQIADACGRANIVEGLERTEGSLTQAFVRGMEMTMWGTPSLRSLALSEEQGSVAGKSKDRKQKTAALSPSGGSAPRTETRKAVPKTREEAAAMALQALREDPSLTGS